MANVTETYVDASDGSEVSKAETYSVTHKEKNPQKVADYTYQDYRESVERVYSHKDISYIYGYPEKAVRPDGTFKPDQDIARVEVMKLINGMVNRSITTEELEKLGAVNPYTDLVDTHWGYPQVMEATIPHSGADWHGTSYNDGKFNVIIERCVDENGKEIAKAVVSQMNQYFIDHPEMVLGEMREVNGPYGPETACLPMEGRDLGDQLNAAIQNIQGSITEYVLDDPEVEDKSIPADPEVRNFSYTLVDGQVYYRENSRMTPAERSRTAQERIKGLIGLRNCVRTLIEYQTEDYPNADIQAEQSRLNSLYDAFVKEHGHIAQWNIKVHFSKHTGEWNVEGKAVDRGNVKASNTYGTKRINGS